MFTYRYIYKTIKEKCYFITLLFSVLIHLSIYGQTKTSNISLENKANSLFLKSKNHLKKGEYNKAIALAEESLVIYNSTNNYKAIGDNYNQIATAYFYRSKFRDALKTFQKSKTFFEKAGFKKGVASTTNNIGAIYYSLGNYSKALDNYKIAIKIHEGLQNNIQVAGTTQNIGNIYFVLNDFINAKKYYKQAEKNHTKSNDIKSLALVKSSLGRIYIQEKNYSKALSYFNTALKLAEDSKNKQVQVEVLYNIGKLYNYKNNQSKSINYLKESILISDKIENNLQKSTSLIALGNAYLKSNRINTGISSCEKGLQLAKQLNSISTQEEACKCLYEAYKVINNNSKALLYNEQMYVFRDSLHIKQTSDKILNMKFEKEILLDSISHIEKERQVALAHQKIIKKKEGQRNIFITIGFFAFIIAISVFSRLKLVKKSKVKLQIEKDRSEHLLHNILPVEVAEELKEKGYVDAQDFETATILFTDFKSFTETASLLTPQELVEEINICFKAFDKIIEHYQIEKIKTIGDAYMAVGGLPKPDINAVKKTILAALDMQNFISQRKQKNYLNSKPAFQMRVGIHVGPIVAGIVGVKKFQYDVWGDTVNIASRMESNSKVGKVNISNDTYSLIKNEKDLTFEYRGKIKVKGKGELEMYFVTNKEYSKNKEHK